MISHPAHFHLFRYTILNLRQHGHELVIVIRPKDVLEQLCIDAGFSYIKVKDRPDKGGLIRLAFFMLLSAIVRMAGASIAIQGSRMKVLRKVCSLRVCGLSLYASVRVQHTQRRHPIPHCLFPAGEYSGWLPEAHGLQATAR